MSLIWVYDEHVGKERNTLSTCDPAHRCWLIREGSVVIKDHLRDTEITVEAGSWVIISQDNVINQHFSSNAALLSIAFSANWPDGQGLLPTPFLLRLDAAQHSELETTATCLSSQASGKATGFRAWRRAQFSFDDHLAHRQALFGWLRLVMNVLESHGIHPRRHQTADERVRRAHALLPEMGFSGAVDYERLCREAGLSRAQLDRLFIRDYGVSVRECRDRLCLVRANELLQTSDFAVAEIADELGFKTPSHFCAWFRRKAGQSPGAFRRTRR